MIDANELVDAIKRVRGAKFGKPLHLIVPRDLSEEVKGVLAQLDITVMVSKWLVDDAAFLIDAETNDYLDLRPPPKSFSETIREEPAYGIDTHDWKRKW